MSLNNTKSSTHLSSHGVPQLSTRSRVLFEAIPRVVKINVEASTTVSLTAAMHCFVMLNTINQSINLSINQSKHFQETNFYIWVKNIQTLFKHTTIIAVDCNKYSCMAPPLKVAALVRPDAIFSLACVAGVMSYFICCTV